MNYVNRDLPAYPVASDMWQELADESRPIVVYGMGNGADKLIARFEKYNIKISDFFASDGFVRGHMFHGMRVKSFSEIKETYTDFVIVLSFASNRSDVIEMLTDINASYDMYVPDMPIAGTAYFDSDFYNRHYEEIVSAYERLADDASRSVFSSVIWYKLTGRIDYIMKTSIDKDTMYSMLPSERISRVIDAGAYNGDTLKEAIKYFPNLGRVTALEPDPKNYKKLKNYAGSIENIEIDTINAAVWNACGTAEFMSGGNRNSSISSTSSYKHKDTDIDLLSVDSLMLDTDYIKYDVEGAEYEALLGSDDTIKRSHPTMLVSLYHRSRDIFYLINYLAEKYPFYSIKLCRLTCIPAWEINLMLFDT